MRCMRLSRCLIPFKAVAVMSQWWLVVIGTSPLRTLVARCSLAALGMSFGVITHPPELRTGCLTHASTTLYRITFRLWLTLLSVTGRSLIICLYLKPSR